MSTHERPDQTTAITVCATVGGAPFWQMMLHVGPGDTINISADEALATLKTQRDELLTVTQGFRRKLATYVSVYPGDKELRKLLDDCDAAIAKATT